MKIKALLRPVFLYSAAVASLMLLGASASAQQSPAETGGSASAAPVGAITGRVFNSAGEPLVGATVYVSALGQTSGRNTAVDASGNFRLDGLEAAAYSIWASAPG